MRRAAWVGWGALLLLSVAHAEPLPLEWAGQWEGQTHVLTGPGKIQELTTRLTLTPLEGTSDWRWRIQYAGEPLRDYLLRSVDPVRGHYLLDEGQGILIDTFWVEGRLTSQFMIQGKVVTMMAELREGWLVQSSTMTSLGGARVSGGARGIPEVKSLPLLSVQTDRLKRVSDR